MLIILLTLGLATGVLAQGYDGIQSAGRPLQSAGDGELVKIAAVIVAVIVGVVVAVIAFTTVLKWQRKRLRTICRLEIQNLGNVRSRYQLLAEEPAGALRFQFTLDGVNLHQRQVTQATERVEEPERGREEATRAKRVDQLAPSGSLTGLERAQQTAGQAKGISAAAASALGTVGALLPRSVGTPLRNWASQLRRQQAAVSRVEHAPRQVLSRILKSPGRTSRVRSLVSPARVTTLPPQTTGECQATPVTRTIVDAWAQTPFVEPGETLTVDLLIDPIERPRKTQHYPIVVTSRSIEQADAPLVVEEGSVQIEGVSWFRHLLPFL